MHGSFTIFPLGDSALVIDFGDSIDVNINRRVIGLFKKLQLIQEPLIVDMVPAYSSLAVYYDTQFLQQEKKYNESSFDLMTEFIEELALEDLENSGEESRLIKIPVCYHPSMGPDLISAANLKDISTEEFIQIHTSGTYRVFMIGFLPGFPYMGEVDSRIVVPRRLNPRKEVFAGSVGIAGKQTGIYPFTSPGGWQIIGRTPVEIFNVNNGSPALLQPGDEVTFYSITEHEFADYKSRNT